MFGPDRAVAALECRQIVARLAEEFRVLGVEVHPGNVEALLFAGEHELDDEVSGVRRLFLFTGVVVIRLVRFLDHAEGDVRRRRVGGYGM
jgi:hypothetical protein